MLQTPSPPFTVRRGDILCAWRTGAGSPWKPWSLSKVYGEGFDHGQGAQGGLLEFPNGEFAAIMGPSGSGKSTLLHILGAGQKPSSGRVIVGGTELGALG